MRKGNTQADTGKRAATQNRVKSTFSDDLRELFALLSRAAKSDRSSSANRDAADAVRCVLRASARCARSAPASIRANGIDELKPAYESRPRFHFTQPTNAQRQRYRAQPTISRNSALDERQPAGLPLAAKVHAERGSGSRVEDRAATRAPASALDAETRRATSRGNRKTAAVRLLN